LLAVVVASALYALWRAVNSNPCCYRRFSATYVGVTVTPGRNPHKVTARRQNPVPRRASAVSAGAELKRYMLLAVQGGNHICYIYMNYRREVQAAWLVYECYMPVSGEPVRS